MTNPLINRGNSNTSLLFQEQARYNATYPTSYPSVSSVNLSLGTTDQSCKTSTFYLHLPALPGQKMELKEIQTLATGNFIAIGNTKLADDSQEGFLLRMSNDGTLVAQKKLQINGLPVTLNSIRVTTTNSIFIAGSIQDGKHTLFVARLKDDFSFDWVQTFVLPAEPIKVRLELFDANQIAIAAQLSSSILYASLGNNGSIAWIKETVLEGLTDLVGFSQLNYVPLGLVANCMSNGKQQVLVIEIDKKVGATVSSHTIGASDLESKCFTITAFSDRLNLLNVEKGINGYQLVRNNMYSSAIIETKHLFKLPGMVDFSISAAMDNAGDALGYCLPGQGVLGFIKHFSYYQSETEFARQYKVPLGSSLSSIARSFDGGFLFGLNTKEGGEIIMIKTDSAGVLADCGYESIATSFQEKLMNANTKVTTTSKTVPLTGTNAFMSGTPIGLLTQFDCRKNYCPIAPLEDSCLDTYFKTYRSNSYSDAFTDYLLLHNNVQVAGTNRIDRILGGRNLATYGLKLFDGKGLFIKGVDVFRHGVSIGSSLRKVDDKSFMLITPSTENNILCFTFTLVTDNLEIIWSKSVKTYNAFEFGSGGPGFGDVHKDNEGNYYFVGSSTGFLENPKVLIYKMDVLGNALWLKAYEIEKGAFGPVKAVSTTTSLILIIEGGGEGSATVRVNKATGQMLNSFMYKNTFAGIIYKREAKFENDRILYAGNDRNERLALASFDSTGRPMKLKVILNSSIPRATAIQSGMLYTYYQYFNGSGFKDVLLKVDSTLNVVFVNEYEPIRWGYPKGMGIGSNGYIYMGGNYTHGGSAGTYYDPFMRKYDPKGELGSCGFSQAALQIQEIDPQTVALSFKEILRFFQPIDLPVDFFPNENGQSVDDILCSSKSDCNFIKLDGPTAICDLNKEYIFKAQRNLNCTVTPVWTMDTSLIKVKTVTDTTIVVVFKKSGMGWIKAKLNTGCVYFEDSIRVQVQNVSSFVSLGNDTTLCAGTILQLNAHAGYTSYRWQDGSSDSTFNVTKSGLYKVIITDACGHTFMDSIQVLDAPPIVIDLGADITKCNNDSVVIKAPSGFISYHWSPNTLVNSANAQQVTVNPKNETVYKLSIEKTPGCFAFDSITVKVHHSPAVYLGSDKSFCQGDSAILNAGNDFQAYLWSTGDTSKSIRVKQKGLYIFSGTTSEGCKSYDTLEVKNVFKNPVVQLNKDTALCKGDSKLLDAGSGFNSYIWDNGATTRTIKVNAIGSYKVAVIDANGCSSSDSSQITRLMNPPAHFLPHDTVLCSYGSLLIQPTASFQSYLWSSGETIKSITVKSAGTFSLQVKDQNNCTGKDTISITLKQCMEGFYIPSAFTPNRDGKNDVFRPLLFGSVQQFRFAVYNRWGEKVFETNELQKGWDGRQNKKENDNNVFVWTCQYQFAGQEVKLEKGTVVLIH